MIVNEIAKLVKRAPAARELLLVAELGQAAPRPARAVSEARGPGLSRRSFSPLPDHSTTRFGENGLINEPSHHWTLCRHSDRCQPIGPESCADRGGSGGRDRGRRGRRGRLRIGARLARRGVSVVLLEAEPEPALQASGTNSGILHTGLRLDPGRARDRADPALGRAARPRCSRPSASRCCAAARVMRPRRRPSRDRGAWRRTRAQRGRGRAPDRRRARDPRRVGHRPGRLHARPGRSRGASRRASCAPAFAW